MGKGNGVSYDLLVRPLQKLGEPLLSSRMYALAGLLTAAAQLQ